MIPSNWINITAAEHIAYLEDDLAECTRVVIDTETTGLSVADEVFGIVLGVGNRKGDKTFQRAYWFNFDNHKKSSLHDKMLEILRLLFTDGKWNLVFHNASFDLKMIRGTFDIQCTHDNLNDTMLMALVLQRFQQVSLKVLSRVLLNRVSEWNKQVQEWFKAQGFRAKDDRPYNLLPDNIIFPYACEDAENTYDLFYTLIPYYRHEPETLQTIYKLERVLSVVTANLEHDGMVVDVDYFTKLATKLRSKMDKLLIRLGKRLFNTNNTEEVTSMLRRPKLMSAALYDAPTKGGLGLDPTIAPRTPKLAFSFSTPMLLRSYPDVEEIQWLDDYKFFETALTKFVEPILEKRLIWEDDDTGQEYSTIHTTYWQIKDTGRFGSSNINLQNITNDKLTTPERKRYSIRNGFIAQPGLLYVSMDFKAFEVAILANASQDPKLVNDVLNGVDFHSTVGSIAYGRPYEELRNHVDEEAIHQRTQIKRTSFLFIYGGGVKKCAVVNNISVSEAQQIKDSIERAYPAMVDWRQQITSQAAGQGKVFTLCGRLRRIDPKFAYTTVVNTICQGTAADIIKFGHVDCERLLRQGSGKSRQVATIHDEIHFYLHPDDAELVPRLVAALETQRFDPPNRGANRYVPMQVEISMGDRWGSMKEVTVNDVVKKLKAMKRRRKKK